MATSKHLPGFSRDSSTGHYHKKDDKSQPKMKPQKDRNVMDKVADYIFDESKPKWKPKNENFHPFPRTPKNNNAMNFLGDRALGQYSGVQAKCNYLEMKLQKKEEIEKMDLNFGSIYPMDSVHFVKGGFKSIFGLWHSTDSPFDYVLGGTPHINIDPSLCLGYVGFNTRIQDVCDVFNDVALVIYNNYKGCNMELVWRDNTAPSGYDFYTHFHSGWAPLFCCSVVNAYNFQIAVGGKNCVTYYNSVAPMQSYEVIGNVLTTSFDTSGHLILSGRHDGFVHIFDIRCDDGHPVCFQAERGYNRCIVDSLYESDNKIILTGTSNDLYTIDLRNKKRVCSFYGHHHSVNKSYMSKTDSLLCVNGADNVIRIWSITGGRPLYEIHPPSPETQIRGWLESDANKNLLYYFENGTRKVFTI